MQYLKVVARIAQIVASRIVRRVRAWWLNHGARMARESGYAEAFTTVLLAAAELLSESRRAKYLVHELVDAYVATLRARTARSGAGDTA